MVRSWAEKKLSVRVADRRRRSIVTWTLRMRDLRLFIFRCGHRAMPSSRQRFLRTVSPTFSSRAALVMGM